MSVKYGLGELRADLHEALVRSIEKRAPAQQALEVQVGVVLPGVANTTEDLYSRVTDGGQPAGEGLGAQRGRMSFRATPGVGGPQGVDHAAAGELDCLVHVDAQVLDRLESADRLAELAPHFGVFDDEVQDRTCRTERVSGP